MNDYESMYNGTSGEALKLPPDIPLENPVKPELSFTQTERTTAVCLLFGGFLVMRLGIIHPSGLLTTLLYWSLLTAETVFLKKSEMHFRLSDKAMLVMLYLFAGVYTVTANELIKFLNSVFLIMADSLLLFRMANPEGEVLRFLPISLLRSVFELPFSHFGKARTASVSGTKGKALWKNAAYILIGLVIAIPLTAVTATLLVDADENMSVLLGNFLRFEPIEPIRFAVQFLIGLLIGSAMFSALYATAHKTVRFDKNTCEKQMENCRFLPNMIVYATVTPICVLYLMFFIAQMQYLMGGFTGETSGFSYAEYARNGFFQLCTVCCINLAVLGGMGFFARHSGAVKPITLKIYSIYLCICSLFLAGTAIAKMFMYIGVYGMTQLRVYTTWFMVLLVIGFGAILLRQFFPGVNLGKTAFAAFVIMFGLLCFSRPDALIVRYNAEMYFAGELEEFDTSVMEYTSDDAWAALSSYDVAERAELGVSRKLGDAYERVCTDFYRGLNLSAWELMANEP